MKPARNHTSEALKEFFKENDTLEAKKVAFKMTIAARIDEAIKSKGMRKNEFALRMRKQSSEISKWLSGNQNFTIETLIEIEHALGVELIAPVTIPCNPCVFDTVKRYY